MDNDTLFVLRQAVTSLDRIGSYLAQLVFLLEGKDKLPKEDEQRHE